MKSDKNDKICYLKAIENNLLENYNKISEIIEKF